ncbi:hypothetical protein [Mycobacteroides abscessus]|uniref:hypothetical protein n=1 Tax=Mycobacteroides abscessus TaxID=36809 RepID=UPI001042296E|nr:hypothetical protein [Mycobacteroides abscessus]
MSKPDVRLRLDDLIPNVSYSHKGLLVLSLDTGLGLVHNALCHRTVKAKCRFQEVVRHDLSGFYVGEKVHYCLSSGFV